MEGELESSAPSEEYQNICLCSTHHSDFAEYYCVGAERWWIVQLWFRDIS